MVESDSCGALAMRNLAGRLKNYADEVSHDPPRQFDLRHRGGIAAAPRAAHHQIITLGPGAAGLQQAPVA
jgi:hypothetical protein